MRHLTAAVIVLAVTSCVAAGEIAPPCFVKKPVTSKAGGTFRVDFAVDRETDVAVCIENAEGRIIRHLVAGMLGNNPPAPLKARALEQSVEWDGNNDLGKPAAGGPFRVRVGLGLKPSLDKMIGFNPVCISSVRAIAVDPKGQVFVFYCFGTIHPSDNSMAACVFSRDGKYLRTIMPYPANLPDDKLKGVKRIELEGGAHIPFIYQAETRSLIPGAGDNQNHEALATSDGRVAFVGCMEYTRYANPGPLHVVVLNADGSVPVDGPVKTRIGVGVSATLAMSPDEKTLYASDVRTAKDHYGLPNNTLYKFTWDDKEATLFLGGKEAAGDLALNDPKGICTDKDGNLFVADKGNNRIAVFKPDGSLLGSLATSRPERVSVNRRTGAVYVLGGSNINELLKFKSWKDPQSVAQIAIPSFHHDGYRVSMAMDDSADQTVLWIGSHAGSYAHFGLLRIEDKGDAFGGKEDITTRPDNSPGSIGPVLELSLDRERELLYVGPSARYNGRTGKNDNIRPILPSNIWAGGSTSAVGLDGFIYVHHGKGVSRFSPDNQPAAVGGNLQMIANDGSLRLHARGVTADAKGNVYLIWQKPGAQQFSALAAYGPDGVATNEKLIDADIRSLNSVRTDYQGNIYLALGLRPGKDTLPPGLKGKLPDGPKDPDAVMGVNYYPFMYGSIAKFGPDGGEILKGNGGVECGFNYAMTTSVKGARWIAGGASCVPSWRTGTGSFAPDICQCESPRFDVDGFGRSFYPDAARFRVGVLDTNGNEICTFGGYGNQDSSGPGSLVPAPEIPFCWVQAIAVGDEAAYVGDRLNQRIVRIKLTYQAEADAGSP